MEFQLGFCEGGIDGFSQDFLESGRLVNAFNATFLVLALKKGGAEDLRDYRPISLVGSLYKLWAKVLASRLKRYWGK